MNNFEVLSVVLMKNEKFLAVVDVRAWGKICLRFKIIPAEKGGYFVGTGSIKVGVEDGKDKFEQCFLVEMRSDEKLLRDIVVNAYKAALGQNTYQQAPSAFDSFGSEKGLAPSQPDMFKDEGVPF